MLDVDDEVCDRLDTIGVCGVDVEGQSVATCSTGGLLLGTPGRQSHAAQYGAAVYTCYSWVAPGYSWLPVREEV